MSAVGKPWWRYYNRRWLAEVAAGLLMLALGIFCAVTSYSIWIYFIAGLLCWTIFGRLMDWRERLPK